MADDIREYKIIIGSKAFFDNHVRLLDDYLSQEYTGYLIENFLELEQVRDGSCFAQ
ncbi:MAG: hypothetical protein ACOWWO_08535 [Peptococcaceae bacterium]